MISRKRIAEVRANVTTAPVFEPGSDSTPINTGETVFIRCAADIETRPVGWLRQNVFVAGAINLLIGMPDVGKTVQTCDTAARVTTGEAWPPVGGVRASNKPGSVVFLCAEDSPETTLVSRLKCAGANLNKVHFIEGVARVDVKGNRVRDSFDIVKDVQHIKELADRLGDVRLVIIDPLDSYINAKTDTNIGNQARAALWPLKDWCEQSGVTAIIVHHFNKSSTTNAMDRVSGARSFGALPRSVWAIGRDPDDESRTIMAPIKLNLIRHDLKRSLAYRVESSTINADVPVVVWIDEDINVNANAIVEGKSVRTQKNIAADWLRDMLANGPMPATDLKANAEEAGISWRTIEKAKDAAGAASYPVYDPAKCRIDSWVWKLRDQDPPPL